MTDASQDVMIEVDNLTKHYGATAAIQDISFTCRKGEVVGLLGPNGAGKTTTMRILTGYMPPTRGHARIAGYDTIQESIQARQRLGYMPETVPLYPEMTVEDYLAFFGRMRRVDNLWERVDDALDAVDLLDQAENFIGRLSKGMRQRVGLAQALLHDPEVMILDEPTIGLDPAQILEVRQLIAELGRERTLLISTHILSEVEQICSRVIMLINGRIWADMPMAQATGREGGDALTLKLQGAAADAPQKLGAVNGVTYVSLIGDNQFRLSYDGRDETRALIASSAVNAGWGLLELTPARTSLEELFMSKLRDADLALAEEADEEWPELTPGETESDETEPLTAEEEVDA